MVDKVHPESSAITSFILRPTDGRPVIRHKPGQYLTFWLEIPGHPPIKRNHSISQAANGETYRISVKRESQGLASGWLHDHAKSGTVLKIAAPAGEFFLAENPERPVVLMSGGVGLTPMVAMLEAIAQHHPDLPVQYLHGTLDGWGIKSGRLPRVIRTGGSPISIRRLAPKMLRAATMTMMG